MPGTLLHLGAGVTCAHGGTAAPTSPSPRVLVGGQPVVSLASVYSVAGCSLPPQAGGPCVSAQFVTAATRVFVLGVPVLLLDSQAVCAPTGTPLIVGATQPRVTGV